MIVCAGLTPAWQQIMCFDGLAVGEVNRAQEVHWCASGKVVNVAVALAHLQTPVRCLTVLGGPSGKQIDGELAGLKIERNWVWVDRPTRTCTTLLNRATGDTTELVENAAPLLGEELQSFRERFRAAADDADVVVISGSSPVGTPADLFAELLKTTRARSVLDIRGPELIAALECKPLFIKPNREELEHTLASPIATSDRLHAVMRELNERGAEWVLVSQGKLALWISGHGHIYRVTPPAVRYVNPIGSGDSLAAGIAWAIAMGKPPLEAVRYGVAAAGDNVGQLLPARLDLGRVHQLTEEIQVKKS